MFDTSTVNVEAGKQVIEFILNLTLRAGDQFGHGTTSSHWAPSPKSGEEPFLGEERESEGWSGFSPGVGSPGIQRQHAR
jgi:hypothetical protein